MDVNNHNNKASNQNHSVDEDTGEVIIFQGSSSNPTTPTKLSSNSTSNPTTPNGNGQNTNSNSAKKKKKKSKSTPKKGQSSEENSNNNSSSPNNNQNATTDNRSQEDLPLEERVLQQIEYYFNDNNLKKDKFMQQEMEKETTSGPLQPVQQVPWSGWIRLETLQTFPKLQKLTVDLQVIRDSIKRSNRLVLSEDGSKLRRTSSYQLKVNTPNKEPKENKQRKNDDKTLYLSYLPKDYDRNKVVELLSSIGVDSSVIQRVDVPYKTPDEIKGIAFVELNSKNDMTKALECWNSSKGDFAKTGIKMKPYLGSSKATPEQSPIKDESSAAMTSSASPTKATSIYESVPTFNYTSNKSKRRPSLSEKDKQRWEPDPTTSSMRPKLNLAPKSSTHDRVQALSEASTIHPVRQPLGPDSANAKGFANFSKGVGRGRAVL